MEAVLTATIDYSIIQGAFYAGFEPSSDDLSDAQLFIEAEEFLFNIQFQQQLKTEELWQQQQQQTYRWVSTKW